MTLTEFRALDKSRQQLFAPIWSNLLHHVFGDVPRYYDQGNALASLGLCSWWSRKFVRVVTCPQKARILDVCSGTHDVARRILRRESSASLHAVDKSPAMIKEGQRLSAKVDAKISAVVADAHVLPYGDAVFDAATLQFATRHLKFVEAFAEIFRILKPGGIFYHCDMLRPEWRVIRPFYFLYLRIALRVTAAWFGSSAPSRQCIGYFVESIDLYLTPSEMTGLLEALGFTEVRQLTFLTGILSIHVARKPGP